MKKWNLRKGEREIAWPAISLRRSTQPCAVVAASCREDKPITSVVKYPYGGQSIA